MPFSPFEKIILKKKKEITSSCVFGLAWCEAAWACSLSSSFPFTLTFTYCVLLSRPLSLFPSLSSLSGEMPLPPSLSSLSLHLRRALTFHPPSIGSCASPPSFFPPLPHPKSSSRQLLPIFFSILFISPSLFASSSFTPPPYFHHGLSTSLPSSLLLIITFTPSVRHTYIRLIMHYPPRVLCPQWLFQRVLHFSLLVTGGIEQNILGVLIHSEDLSVQVQYPGTTCNLSSWTNLIQTWKKCFLLFSEATDTVLAENLASGSWVLVQLSKGVFGLSGLLRWKIDFQGLNKRKHLWMICTSHPFNLGKLLFLMPSQAYYYYHSDV